MKYIQTEIKMEILTPKYKRYNLSKISQIELSYYNPIFAKIKN